jgi:hypothetical protein
MRRLVAALLLIAPVAHLAHAARPFVTDDARVVDKGGCQIETFVKSQRRYDENEIWFVPACNPWGVELTAGHIRVDGNQDGRSSTVLLQAKTLLKPLVTNGSGFAFSVGTFAGHANSPYVNAIGSFSFADDRVVIHTNLGVIRDNEANSTRRTWGVGGEVLLAAPRWYGIIESYGMRGENPTLHTGLRIWLVPGSLQLDTTVGIQHNSPERRFGTVGLRILW